MLYVYYSPTRSMYNINSACAYYRDAQQYSNVALSLHQEVPKSSETGSNGKAHAVGSCCVLLTPHVCSIEMLNNYSHVALFLYQLGVKVWPGRHIWEQGQSTCGRFMLCTINSACVQYRDVQQLQSCCFIFVSGVKVWPGRHIWEQGQSTCGRLILCTVLSEQAPTPV